MGMNLSTYVKNILLENQEMLKKKKRLRIYSLKLIFLILILKSDTLL